MKLKVSIVQDYYAAAPNPPDETSAPANLARQITAYKEACLAPQLALAEQAVQAGTGLVLLREDCNGAGNLAAARLDRPDLLQTLAECIPGGPTAERLAGLARRGNCYAAGCFLEALDGRIYNTAVLFDPAGRVAGKYCKTHLPPVERLLITPGDSLPVFETDLGRVGMLVCYDMMTPEAARCLALQGADLLLWPSLGYGWWTEAGDFTIRSRAHDNQVIILGALPVHSCVVDAYGDFLAQGGLAPAALVEAEVEPGADPLQDPLHHNTYLTDTASLRERHLFERQPALYATITDPHPPLVARYPDTRMRDLDTDKHKAWERYRAAWGRLHWRSRPDRPTEP